MSRMKQLMKGLPGVTISAQDLDRDKHFMLRYDPEMDRYYVNLYGIDEATFDGVYGNIRWVKIAIDTDPDAPLLPGHVLMVVKLMPGITFEISEPYSFSRPIRWTHGIIVTENDVGTSVELEEADWLDIVSELRYDSISMRSLVRRD